jgi:hypothetical protein
MVFTQPDFTAIQGCDWLPATTQRRDNAQALLTPDLGVPSPRIRYPTGQGVPFGQFDPELVTQELGLLRTLGLTSIRMYGSMVAWVVDPVDYLRNLGTIASLCKQLGMQITYKIWTKGLGVDAMAALVGTQGSKAGLQTESDLFTVVNNLKMPPAGSGSHFPEVAFLEPGAVVDAHGGDPALWPPFTVKGVLVGTLVADYVKAVDDLFTSRALDGVLLSYDVLNEPEIGVVDKNGIVRQLFDNTVAFVKWTYDTIVNHRRQNGKRRPYFTVGLAGYILLPEFYNAFRRVGAPMDYASFHIWADDVRLLDRLGRPIGSEFIADWSSAEVWKELFLGVQAHMHRHGYRTQMVVSEFYAHGQYPPTRNNLDKILDAIDTADMGWQIWGPLESNVFRADRTSGRIVPIDGLIRTYDPPDGVYAARSSALRYEEQPELWPPPSSDMKALLRWTGGSPP